MLSDAVSWKGGIVLCQLNVSAVFIVSYNLRNSISCIQGVSKY